MTNLSNLRDSPKNVKYYLIRGLVSNSRIIQDNAHEDATSSFSVLGSHNLCKQTYLSTQPFPIKY